MLSREEQIGRLQSSVREMQDEVGRKDSIIQKIDMDMGSIEEQRRKTDDNVSCHSASLSLFPRTANLQQTISKTNLQKRKKNVPK